MTILSGVVNSDGLSGSEADVRGVLRLHPVIALEENALRRWLRGDPNGFLELSADDVVYFDPFTTQRITGKTALAAYYEPLRGKVSATRYEIVNPLVQESGAIAILTYNFVSYGGNENAMHWNCTEAFRLDPAGFRIIQTHWSFTHRALS